MTMDDNFIDFKCPYCAGTVSFSTDTAGQIQECPECSETLIVPQASSEFGQKIPIPITTPRLVLRRLADSDWKDLLEFTSDDQLFRYSEGSPLDEEQVLQWLARDKATKLTTPDAAFCLAMQLQAGGKVIGHVSMHFIDSLRQQAGFNIFVNRGFQRQGFGTEAVNALLCFCFEAASLHRVIASFDSRDVSARRMFEKAGMRHEGQFVKDRFLNGEWVDTVWLAMLSDEYAKSKSSPPRQSPA